MNDNFQNEKNKEDILKKLYIRVGIIVILGVFLSLNYLITSWIINPRYEDKTVYSSTDLLEDTTTIALMIGDSIDKEQSLKEFKEENNIQSDINQQFLIDFLEDSGYKLQALESDKIVFRKENNNNTLVADKYYLGEKDGYFAIYKTDKDGRAFIESEKDVFREYKKVNTIPVSAEEEIKSFKHYYDSKEEALERLSGYMN